MNTFGHFFRISTFGESHGQAIGALIDGCPAGIPLTEEDFFLDMQRRRPGQSAIVTQRKEDDIVRIVSGVFQNFTTGAPIVLLVENQNARSKDYDHLKNTFRPSHADYTWHVRSKGFRDFQGGGRSSARETAARVAAGVVAKKILSKYRIQIHAFVSSVGDIHLPENQIFDWKEAEKNAVRCPDPLFAQQMEALIKQVRKDGDTVGGCVRCQIDGVPAGLGAPVFGKLNALLAQAMFSLPAVKGFEIGSGFLGATMRGSAHNDIFYMKDDLVQTKTNFSGGIQGGISNGAPIYFRVAFKPVATIMRAQETIDTSGQKIDLPAKGRHDPCVVPRAVPIVEAMSALVLTDLLFEQKIYQNV